MGRRTCHVTPRRPGKSTAAEFIVAAMRAEEITAAFGLIGTHIVEIYDALRAAPDINHVTAKHEGNAALMADAYSRLSGKTSVCFSTAGPGLLNSLAGVGQAYAANSPTVHISGSLPVGSPRRALHAVDDEEYTTRMLVPLTKLSVRPRTLAQLARLLPKCFAAARGAEPGPVHIEIPWDLMRAAPGQAPDYIRREPQYLVDRAGLRRLENALKSSRRPLLCVDALCLRHRLVDPLIGLAETTQAMMAVSYDAFGAVPSAHPLNAGVLSDFYFGTTALQALREADLVIGFGVLENSETEALILKHARVKPILFRGRDLGAMAWGRQLDQLAGKLDRTSARGPENLPEAWYHRRCFDEWQKAVARLARPRPNGRMHFGRAMMKFREWIDGDLAVILDAGSHEIWARSILPSFGASSFIGSGNRGGMGYALPGLIGAKIAAPRRRAVAITGDGCLLMSIADLCTLAGVGGPAILVVMNNAMYGEIRRVQLEQFGAHTQTDIPALDFAAIARSFGLKGIRIEKEKALGPGFGDAFSSSRPVVVDIVCGPDVAFPSFP